MAKYTIVNNPGYIQFIGIPGTAYETEQFAFRKTSIKQVRTTIAVDAIHLVHLDDTDSPFQYYDLINPNTGLPFTSIHECKTLIMLWLNELATIEDIFLGQWNALDNTPELLDDGYWMDGTVLTKAAPKSYFIVTFAGNTTIDGLSVWEVGDYIKSNGTNWIRIPASSVVSAIKVFFDSTEITDPLWDSIDNVQAAITLLQSSAKKRLDELNDTNISNPENGSVLSYNNINHKWESVVLTGGRAIIQAIAILNGTNTQLPDYGDGLYCIDIGTTAPWVPDGAVVGDILKRTGNGFSIEYHMTDYKSGTYDITYINGKYTNSVYSWSGTKWISINAYKPSNELLSINVSNPIGDINSTLTGSDLNQVSISKILDDMLFETIYTAPVVPTIVLPNGTDIERGSDIIGSLTPVFDQNGGGSINSYSITALVDGVVQSTESGYGHTIPDVNLDDISGYNLKAHNTASKLSSIKYTVNYLSGNIPQDNKGNTYPDDIITAGYVEYTSSWISRYPIWFGAIPNSYGVIDTTDLTNPPVLTSSDIKLLSNKLLFVDNITLTDIIHSGDITVIVALPPGISLVTAELNVGGSWTEYNDLITHYTAVDISSADGTENKQYTVHYARCISGDSYPSEQNYRFTTTGTIIP